MRMVWSLESYHIAIDGSHAIADTWRAERASGGEFARHRSSAKVDIVDRVGVRRVVVYGRRLTRLAAVVALVVVIARLDIAPIAWHKCHLRQLAVATRSRYLSLYAR